VRDLKELMAERDINVDYSAIHRSVVYFSYELICGWLVRREHLDFAMPPRLDRRNMIESPTRQISGCCSVWLQNIFANVNRPKVSCDFKRLRVINPSVVRQ
jgi:hypothetical protein